MRSVWIIAIITATALAGCTSETANLADVVEPTSVDDELTNVTANVAPVANLTASVVNGTAPLVVNFTIDAFDADGDNLTWQFLVNATEVANGSILPASVNYTFDAGLWNATMVVSDGLNSTNMTITVNVTAEAVVLERVPILLEEVSGSGTIGGAYAMTNNAQYAVQCVGFVTGQDGVGCVFLDFNNDLAGMPAIITSDANNVRLAIWDECDPTHEGKGFHGGSSGDSFVLPAGSGCIVAWSSNTGDWGQTRSFMLSIYDYLPDL